MPKVTLPTNFQKKILWRALTGVAIFVLTALFILSIYMLSKVLGFLQPVLIPVAVAGIIAYLLDPIVAWLQKKRLSRFKSVAVVFATFLCATALFISIIAPPISSQLKTAFEKRFETGKALKEKLEKLQETSWSAAVAEYLLEPVEQSENLEKDTEQTSELNHEKSEAKTSFTGTRLGLIISENSEKILKTTTSFVSKSTSTVLSILGLLLGLIMIPIYLYYFLVESASIKDNWHFYVPLKASKFKNEVIDTLKEINGYLISFFRGQVLVAFIDGVLVGIALEIFGLPYGLVLGVLMAFLGVIPFIGNVICLIPALIIAYVHFSETSTITHMGELPAIGEQFSMLVGNEQVTGIVNSVSDQKVEILTNVWSSLPQVWAYPLIVIAIFLVVQQINSLVTAPKIVGDSVGLHPMTVIFSMLFWSLILGGFIGALLAVPLTAAVKVIFRRYIWERKVMEANLDDSDANPNSLDAITVN